MNWTQYIPWDPLVWLYMIVSFIAGAAVSFLVMWGIAKLM